MKLVDVLPQILEILAIFGKNNIGGDYFSSVRGLNKLLAAEKYYMENLQFYINETTSFLGEINSFLIEMEKKRSDLNQNSTNFFENPINVYKTIKRLAVDWEDARYPIMKNPLKPFYEESLKELTDSGFVKPTITDLQGASEAFQRLQNVYALDTRDLAAGKLLNISFPNKLNSVDCFELGKNLYDMKEYNGALEWLLIAREKLAQINNTVDNSFYNLTEIRILEYLVQSAKQSGNEVLTDLINDELLEMDPANEIGLKIENSPKLPEIRDPDFINPNIELYGQVCRGALKQNATEQRPLRCRYFTNNVPFCLIAPFKMEELSHDPFVAVYYEAIFDSEIVHVINTAEKIIERSRIGGIEKALVSNIRVSKTGWLKWHKYKFMSKLKQRLLDISGLSMVFSEDLQVVNYGIGGHYGPHHDFFLDDEKTYAKEGNRIFTALFYINNVEMGGGTAFPHLKIVVPPIKGSLLVWNNMHESLELDFRTRHAGCPVIKGSKWICNEWFRERSQIFRRPCSLELHGHKSAVFNDYA